jgi:transposase
LRLTKDQKIAQLEASLSDLNDRFSALMAVVESQAKRIAEQDLRIATLEDENARLKEELAILKVKKNSGNSSMNPASDLGRKQRTNLREKTGRKPGGQPGHPGETLAMVGKPDEVEEHWPQTCAACAGSLEGIDGLVVATAQVTKLPPIVPIICEHQKIEVVCACGCRNVGEFPAGVVPGAQYGRCVMALVAFLSVRQYIPVARIQELLRDVLSLKISTGGIGRMVRKMAAFCAEEYGQIKAEVTEARQVGADETGTKVNGRKGWFWTWQTRLCTFIVFAASRAYSVVEEHFPDGFANAILSHDCLAAQFKTVARGHQICMAHILRELKFNIEAYRCKWSEAMKALIKESLSLKEVMAPDEHGQAQPWVEEIEHQLDALLAMQIPTKNKKSITLRNRIRKKRDSCFQFLYHPEVPPDNNASERAIRNVKVKQKVSTQFKSGQGAQDFAVIRSIIDTVIKRGGNILQHLANVE